MNRAILLVDDDADRRDSIAGLLTIIGYSTVTAENGLEALQLLRVGTDPCAILLDLAMPVMDGYEFRRKQLESPILSSIPVIIYSCTRDVERAAAELHTEAHIPMPPELHKLASVLRQHCLR